MQPFKQRRAALHYLIKEALKDFTEAIAYLLDDAVVEKTYEVIFQCSRSKGAS